MTKKKKVSHPQIEALAERLSQRPELYERFMRILDLSDPNTGGNGLDVNLLEAFLKPEIRDTARVAVTEDCQGVEQNAGDELKQEDEVEQREKKR